MPLVFTPDDCEGCGGCCHLIVELAEHERVPGNATEINDDNERVIRRRDDCSCVYLDPTTRRCRIYENRPQVCRDFNRGSGLCFTAILHFGPKKDEEDAA